MDFDAIELIARSDAALDQFGFLTLGFAQFLDDIGTKVLIETEI